jgi:hypothetical protein
MNEMAKGAARHIANAPAVPRTPHLSNRNGRKLAVGIDPSGRVHFGKDNVGGDHAVAVLGEQVSDAHLAELREDGASYIFAGAKGDDLAGAMTQLASLFGARTLLLEGGGGINGAFLKHGLIQHLDLSGGRRRRRIAMHRRLSWPGRRSPRRRAIAAADALRDAGGRYGLAASRGGARAGLRPGSDACSSRC